METLSYFDCNVSIGRPAHGLIRPCPSPAELLAEMDRLGVERALVRHALMSEQSPAVGNPALAEAIADQPRLVGSWAILPPQTDELPPAPEFFRQMAAANVRALWAFAEQHRYLLDRFNFGGFLDEVAERRIPLLIPRDAGGPRPPDTWRMLTRLLEQYPDLTLILAHHGPWGEDRFFRPFLEHYPRFYLDISRYELDCGLRDLVARYGPERLLYGSHFPEHSMGGPRLMVARAEIDEEARQAIAGGNLERLLAEVML